MDPETISAIGGLSGPALMVIAFVTGAKGLWVWGWAHRQELAAKDKTIADLEKREIYYRDMAFRLANLTERVTDKRASETGHDQWTHSND